MLVKVGNRMVLDASGHGYTGAPREAPGNIAFPAKDVTPLFAGPWIDLPADESTELEIAVGDEGGAICPGFPFSPRRCPTCRVTGVPKLPVFVVGNLTDADRQFLGTHLPPECLQGTFFKLMPAKSVSSLFND